MNQLLSSTQNIGRWTDGWLAYSLYGIVVVAILIFLIVKIRKARKHRARNKELRKKN
jgi:hypothetical protein